MVPPRKSPRRFPPSSQSPPRHPGSYSDADHRPERVQSYNLLGRHKLPTHNNSETNQAQCYKTLLSVPYEFLDLRSLC